MDGVAAIRGIQLSDGLNLTPKGMRVIVNRMLPTVIRGRDALQWTQLRHFGINCAIS